MDHERRARCDQFQISQSRRSEQNRQNRRAGLAREDAEAGAAAFVFFIAFFIFRRRRRGVAGVGLVRLQRRARRTRERANNRRPGSRRHRTSTVAAGGHSRVAGAHCPNPNRRGSRPRIRHHRSSQFRAGERRQERRGALRDRRQAFPDRARRCRSRLEQGQRSAGPGKSERKAQGGAGAKRCDLSGAAGDGGCGLSPSRSRRRGARGGRRARPAQSRIHADSRADQRPKSAGLS